MNGKILCTVALFGFAICSPVSAQTPSPEKLREAYDVAVKCFLADTYGADNRKVAGDTVRQRYFEKKADATWAVGQKLAKALG